VNQPFGAQVSDTLMMQLWWQ